MSAKTLMVQGTGSDTGKSVLVTALCHIYRRRGLKVAPFKPQNMALNSAVTLDGGEIGRAQALQALACGLEPHTDMNPVLLKPNTDRGAQVIIQGHALSNQEAAEYHAFKPRAMAAVLESYERLKKQYDLIIVEGAGSPAEVNLREGDIANMGFAEAVDCPVVLVGDIDRGGVFAQLHGTLDLISNSERERIAGLIINKFRGDIALLEPGLAWLEQHTGKKLLGVINYLHNLHLDAEDAVGKAHWPAQHENKLRVVVPILPRISNHTDFDPLRLHPQVELQIIGPGETIPHADLIILPGSKSVQADLQFLREQGWRAAIQRHLRYGGKLLGICGGFQMLGEHLHDPDGIEGVAGSCEGLGLLAMDTTLKSDKQLHRVEGHLTLNQSAVCGYEIHAGITTGPALQRPAVKLAGREDGAISKDNQVMGSYLHGLFERPEACAAILEWAGLLVDARPDHYAQRIAAIERLADEVEQQLDMNYLNRLLALPE